MTPAERIHVFAKLWQALRPGGFLFLQGYTPKQLDYKTGGPSALENLYTPELLRNLLADWNILRLDAYEAELAEGIGHQGRSALIGLLAKKQN